ncbi:homocysteine S-methyltransferase family protein [Leucobacter musarum]|uniref:homocysteine S-methyltransferase family protein n=1 Tax=Leucobacter musarum TaxID=1930747 RepID=UPI0006A780E3|nr:homocysteine S-methyltransferase family protein [Leucobacter musarum]
MTLSIADGGIETALTDRLGQHLREFAAFELLDTAAGRIALTEYYAPFIAVARQHALPLVLDTPTWRANTDWGERLGYRADALARINADAVAFVRELDEESPVGAPEIVVNGCVGPRTDEYVAAQRMTAGEAEEYHAPQVRALAEAGADRVTSVTTLDAVEGIGVVRAALAARVPGAVSFIVGADGLLADGSTLDAAIAEVDAATEGGAVGFLVNCAHPAEAARALEHAHGAAELERLIGFRLNAARAGTDSADSAADFAAAEIALRNAAPSANVFGGCCGTDVDHIAALAAAMGERPTAG